MEIDGRKECLSADHIKLTGPLHQKFIWKNSFFSLSLGPLFWILWRPVFFCCCWLRYPVLTTLHRKKRNPSKKKKKKRGRITFVFRRPADFMTLPPSFAFTTAQRRAALQRPQCRRFSPLLFFFRFPSILFDSFVSLFGRILLVRVPLSLRLFRGASENHHRRHKNGPHETHILLRKPSPLGGTWKSPESTE